MATVTRVQTRNFGGSSVTGSARTSSVPVAGNMLLLTFAVYKSGTTAAADISADPTGFTRLAAATLTDTANNLSLGVFVYAKISDGTERDSGGAYTTNGSSYRYLLEEVSGLAAAMPRSVSSFGSLQAASGTVVSGAVYSTKSNQWVYSTVGARGSSTPVPTWGGGSTQFTNAMNTNGVSSGTQQLAASGTSATPQVALTNLQDALMVSLVFDTTDSVAPGGGTTPVTTGYAKVWDGSSWVRRPVKVWDGSAWTRRPIKFRASDGSWRQSNS